MSDKTVLTDERIKEIAETTFSQLQEMPDEKVNGDTWDTCFARSIERAVLEASTPGQVEDRRDADRWRKARELFQAWEIDRAAENMICGIPDEDECTKADNAIDAARAAAGNHKVEGE